MNAYHHHHKITYIKEITYIDKLCISSQTDSNPFPLPDHDENDKTLKFTHTNTKIIK